jgi:hypothetical protein
MPVEPTVVVEIPESDSCFELGRYRHPTSPPESKTARPGKPASGPLDDVVNDPPAYTMQ